MSDTTEESIHRKGRVTEALPLFAVAFGSSVELGNTFSAKISDRKTPPLARATDSVSSHEGAEDIRPRRKSRKRILLEVFRGYGAMTAEEACVRAGLTVGGWKRISELVSEGKLRRTGTTRPNTSGSLADVLELVPTPP